MTPNEDAHSLENENETDKYHGDDEIMRKYTPLSEVPAVFDSRYP